MVVIFARFWGDTMTMRIESLAAEPQQRTLFQLSVASIGMTFVAFVCAISGLFYGIGDRPHWALTFYVLEFGFLVFPYFFDRESSVEEPPNSNSTNALFFSVVVFVLLVGQTLLTIRWLDVPYTRIVGTASGLFADGLIGLMILALLPFIYLAVRTHWLISLSSASARHERFFKNKVLLPAFATCLVSFSFGWSINHPHLTLVCMLIPTIIIIALKEWSARNRKIPLLGMIIAILTILLVAFGAVIFTSSEIGKVVIIGVILTLAMGVAEVCKRVARFPKKIFVGDDGEDDTYLFYLAGANWSSIVFPLLLCFFPLLIVELPIFPIFVLLSIQFLHWHYFFSNKEERISLGPKRLVGLSVADCPTCPIFVSIAALHI